MDRSASFGRFMTYIQFSISQQDDDHGQDQCKFEQDISGYVTAKVVGENAGRGAKQEHAQCEGNREGAYSALISFVSIELAGTAGKRDIGDRNTKSEKCHGKIGEEQSTHRGHRTQDKARRKVPKV